MERKRRSSPFSEKETLSHNPFKNLRLKARPSSVPSQPEIKANRSVRVKNASEKSEDEIFWEAMSDVKEIKEFREIPPKAPSGVKPGRPAPDPSIKVLRGIVNGEVKITLSRTGEYMEWSGPGVSKDLAGKLHGGEFAVQEFIDLHGLTLPEAREAFFAFIMEARRRGLFCVKVIHGRGLRSPNGPVLKEAIKGWLAGDLKNFIRAYATAKDCDGGLGATYILLKRNRK